MVHKAKHVPYGFGALWHGALPKPPNRRIPDGPESGRLMENGHCGLVELPVESGLISAVNG